MRLYKGGTSIQLNDDADYVLITKEEFDRAIEEAGVAGFNSKQELEKNMNSAYNEGFDAGRHYTDEHMESRLGAQYGVGMSDGWELVLKLKEKPVEKLAEFFDGVTDIFEIMDTYSPNIVLQKYKQLCESEQCSDFKIGDYVRWADKDFDIHKDRIGVVLNVGSSLITVLWLKNFHTDIHKPNVLVKASGHSDDIEGFVRLWSDAVC